MTARTRIVASQLGLVTLAALLTVAVTWVVLTIRDNERIDASLDATAQAFTVEANAVVNPATGTAFESASALLATVLDRSVPAPDEVRFSMLGDRVENRSTRGNPTRLYDDKALLTAAAKTTKPTIATVDTQFGPVRYLAVPVSDGTEPSQHFVAAIERNRSSHEVTVIASTVAVVGLSGIILATILSWLTAGRVLAPLRDLRERTAQISQHDLTQRVEVSGTDDIAELAGSFNGMIDRLESAFSAQKRFAADAGHELRTPLTVLRGHIELLADDPSIRAEQRVILLDEIDRMTEIVEDLLALTRAGQPHERADEALNPGELLSQWRALVANLAERNWVWLTDGIQGETFSANRHRLTQVMLQLVQNAINATDEKDRIELGLAMSGSTLFLWVSDSGAGIPPADTERVFEPFARAENQPREGSGTGLGLSIVAEIARSYGGSAYVAQGRPRLAHLESPDTPGQIPTALTGACVVMEIPVARWT